jgi:hypothetical protein
MVNVNNDKSIQCAVNYKLHVNLLDAYNANLFFVICKLCAFVAAAY